MFTVVMDIIIFVALLFTAANTEGKWTAVFTAFLAGGYLLFIPIDILTYKCEKNLTEGQYCTMEFIPKEEVK